jgi:hypothetical protein
VDRYRIFKSTGKENFMKQKPEEALAALPDDSAITQNIPGQAKPLTVDDIKNKTLKKGDPLTHLVYGVVSYCAKIRGTYERIEVSQWTAIGGAGGELRQTRFRVFVKDCFITPSNLKKGKKQPTRLILAVCPACDLRIRASMLVFSLGTPLCFNEGCEKKGEPLELQIGDDPENPGKLNIDTADRVRVANYLNSRGSVPSDAEFNGEGEL